MLIVFLCFLEQSFAQITSVAERISQVENNLIPFVPVKNFKGWNITDRMKYYNVPGVGIDSAAGLLLIKRRSQPPAGSDAGVFTCIIKMKRLTGSSSPIMR